MLFPRKGEIRQPPKDVVAAEDAGRLANDAVAGARRSVDAEWYRAQGGDADFAALTLCRLRRARAGERGGSEHGDEAVRTALTEAGLDAAVWVASRAISYMDETGFPEAVEPWFPSEPSP